MKHLTVDQIVEYVTMKQLDTQSLQLAADVTEHIRSCRSCLRLVRAYQLVEDGMEQQFHARLQRDHAQIGEKLACEAFPEYPTFDS